MTRQFKSLADAEQFLIETGFKLVPNSCDWRNEAGDDAGCYYALDGHYGTLTGFRVEINHARPPGRTRRPRLIDSSLGFLHALVAATTGRLAFGANYAVCLTAYNARRLGEGRAAIVI